jgi:uncharacterized OB-fold protein
VERALPRPTPETLHFWEGTLAGELRLQRCARCARVRFPPRPICPACGAREAAVFAASGRGRLHSYVIHQRAAPGFQPPYVIAVVELDEGPRMLSNLVGVDPSPQALPLDLPLQVCFERVSERIALPLFRPVGGGA